LCRGGIRRLWRIYRIIEEELPKEDEEEPGGEGGNKGFDLDVQKAGIINVENEED
jgi:hypothetical protein